MNDDDNKLDKLLKDMKTMSVDELKIHRSVGINTNRIVNVSGVGIVLAMLFYPMLISFIIGLPIIMVLANAAVCINTVVAETDRLLSEPGRR